MKRTMILAGLVWVMVFGTIAFAGEEGPQGVSGEKKEISVQESGDLARQISYALGYDIFKNVTQYMELDPKYFIMGVTDSHAGKPNMEKDQLAQMLMAYQRIVRQKQMETAKLLSEANRAEGARFLEGNKLKEGVVTLSSGLQYKIISQGNGPLPGPDATVECNYKGSLLDGTVFDSSFTRGKPAVFQVGGVIKGWVQALQLMPVGSRWELYIPSDLAYGDQGAGDAIKPGQTLVFEVELLGIIH